MGRAIKVNGVKHIVQKELKRVFTDKKLVVSLFVMPAILIIGLYYLMGQLQSTMSNDIKEHVSSVYIQNEPENFKDLIITYQYNGNVTYLDKTADVSEIKKDILEGKADLLVVFEDEFLEKINNTNEVIVPEIKTYYNDSEDYSIVARSTFVEGILSQYKQELLMKRFGDVNLISIFAIDKDPSTSILVDTTKASGKFLGMLLPYFLTMMLFQGAMSLGIDAITGEKERGTMASMLLTPLKRKEIVVGKIISISILSSLSGLVYAVSMVASMPIMLKGTLGDNADNINMKFTPEQVIMLLAVVLALVYLYVAIVSLAAVLSKTAKEAATYVTPIYIVVLVAGMITMFTGNSDTKDILYAIPVYGSALSMQGIFTSEITMSQFGLTILGTLVSSGILTLLITKAFNSERIMFNA
jgi:sodium transport system permease protein